MTRTIRRPRGGRREEARPRPARPAGPGLALACWRLAVAGFGSAARRPGRPAGPGDPRRDRVALLAVAGGIVSAAVIWLHRGGRLTAGLLWAPRQLVGLGLLAVPLLAFATAVWLTRRPAGTRPARRMLTALGAITLGPLGLTELARHRSGGLAGALAAGPLTDATSPALAALILLTLSLLGVGLLAGTRPARLVRRRRPGRNQDDTAAADLDADGYDPSLADVDTDELVEFTLISSTDHIDPDSTPQPDAATSVDGDSAPDTDLDAPADDGRGPQTASEGDGGAATDTARTMRALNQVLREFRIDAAVIGHSRGPTVTRYKVDLGPGVKVERIIQLAKNIALATATAEVRILSPIPGESLVGVEIPNTDRDLVRLIDILDSSPAADDPHPLLVGLGKDIEGRHVLANLAKLPHLFIAGATGAGKSVCVNTILVSLLGRATPDQVRLLLIDPKKVELGAYADIPHLLAPIITDPRRAADALHWLIGEMDERLTLLAAAGVRHIDAYNAKIAEGGRPAGAFDAPEQLPYIVTIIDELADLMALASRDVEDAIVRLAAMARAAGIHLVLATQRPSVDVVTGLIKANIPCRLAFATASLADSRVILDQGGAEKLLGHGDALYLPMTASRPERIQGAFVDDDERDTVLAAVIAAGQNPPRMFTIPAHTDTADPTTDGLDAEDQAQLAHAAELVITSQLGSTAMLQRKLRIGHAKAARLIDALEARGVVGPAEGAKARAVLITPDQLDAALAALADPSEA